MRLLVHSTFIASAYYGDVVLQNELFRSFDDYSLKNLYIEMMPDIYADMLG